MCCIGAFLILVLIGMFALDNTSDTNNIVNDADYELKDGKDGGKILVKYKGKSGEVIIPDELNITEIQYHAFGGNSDITKIKSNTVKKIGHAAFHDCTNLESVDFPNVTIIEAFVFLHCYSLETVNFPKVETIGHGAFRIVKNYQVF